MSKTLEDLKAAFAGESQANRRYLAFAKKAEDEGIPALAKMFRAIAEAETVHAHNHLRAMAGIGTSADNVREAEGGEHYEVNTMYPDFLKDAEAEQDKRAINSFRYAWEAEKLHEVMYHEALETLMAGKTIEEDGEAYYVCPVCGFTHKGTPPERCPVCNTPSSRFMKFA